jgi:hypothetical protein
MSKKNRNRWQKANAAAQPSSAVAEPRASECVWKLLGAGCDELK